MVLGANVYKVVMISVLLLIYGCSNNGEVDSSVVKKGKNFAILGPISGGDVSVKMLDIAETIGHARTKTINENVGKLLWKEFAVGSFDINLTQNYESERWVHISITNGEDIDSDDDGNVTDKRVKLEGNLECYCRVDDIQQRQIIVNVFTTIAARFYAQSQSQNLKTFLDDFAKDLFSRSVNGDDVVDYRDIFAYIPNVSSNVLQSANIYKMLLQYHIMDQILAGKDITATLKQDSDSDGLNLWQEILHGTSPTKADTDNDGINDKEEIEQNLDPLSTDSDKDGLSDTKERELYFTNPKNPDSDGDYIPDGVEVAEATNPLESDEDGDGKKDGLQGDPFFKYQWYIKSLGNVVANTASIATIVGDDLNILGLYHKTLGGTNNEPSIIQVVDTGVEAIHEDLNIDLNNSFNAVTHTHDPTATQTVSNDLESPIDIGHGTAVAGIIGAKTNNSLGVRGIVPRAKIAGSNWLEDQTLAELEKVWYSQINDERIAVSNNSWGGYLFDDGAYERVLDMATTNLRHGLGRVFVFAAGNFREDFGNSNLSYLTNNPFVIAVAALNHKDKFASYSNPGSNILVSAYGGEHYYTAPTIMSTLLMGKSYYASEIPEGQKGSVTVDEDTNRNYTYAMNGTSAAAPIVSGVIALTLDACPTLSYRDIRWLIANTALQVDKSNKNWVKNGAGLWHSIDYGYGKINPQGMVALCQSSSFEHLPPLQRESVSLNNINRMIPDTNTTISEYINFNKSLTIEWVGITIDTDHPFAGDLEFSLTSPSGTKTVILTPTETHYAAFDGGFRFSSVAFIDENSYGTWRVDLTDRLENDYGNLKSIKLEVYGH